MATRPSSSPKPPARGSGGALPGVRRPPRRRFRPGALTPRQRLQLLGLGAVLLIGAFFIPFSCEAPPPETAAFETAQVQPPPAPPPPPPPAALAPLFPASPAAAVGAGQADPRLALPPVKDAVMGGTVTPEEIKARVETLSRYANHPVAEQRKEAYEGLLKLGPELVARLPGLIEKSVGAELDRYADAARELKAVNAAPVLITKLEAQDKRVAPYQLFRALAGLDDPKARAYVLASLQGKTVVKPPLAWNEVGAGMDEAQVKHAVETVLGGGPESSLAAAALGRYGSTPEKAAPLVQRLQPLLEGKKGPAKVALVQALAGMEPMAAGGALTVLVADEDAQVRAAALAGLARHQLYSGMAVTALRNDRDPRVRLACARALAENPSEMVLPDLVNMLGDPQLHDIGRRALVLANKGRDLGRYEFVWRDWLEARKGRQPIETPPLEDVPLETPVLQE